MATPAACACTARTEEGDKYPRGPRTPRYLGSMAPARVWVLGPPRTDEHTAGLQHLLPGSSCSLQAPLCSTLLPNLSGITPPAQRSSRVFPQQGHFGAQAVCHLARASAPLEHPGARRRRCEGWDSRRLALVLRVAHAQCLNRVCTDTWLLHGSRTLS